MYPVSTPTPPFTHDTDHRPFPIDFLGLHNRLLTAADAFARATRQLDAARQAVRTACDVYEEANKAFRDARTTYTNAINARSNPNG